MSLDIEQLQSVINLLPDPVFVLTESGCYAGVYGGSDPSYYHDGRVLVGRSLHDVLPRDKAHWMMEQVARALRDDCLSTVEYGLTGRDVEGLDNGQGPSGEIWFEGRIQPLPFCVDGERAVVWAARNITERHRLMTELLQMSESDELTGAYNRRKLMAELEERYNEFRRYGHSISLLMLDLDHFKQVNDRYGHAAGDEVLRSTVRACKGQLRDVDILARFGGEEFVALLPNTPLEVARSSAERLRETVAHNVIHHAGSAIRITVSIGISSFREADHDFEAVVIRADDAMYLAKQLGRNRVEVAA
jgi:diguanylate cyclase (GGDEF)-like protein